MLHAFLTAMKSPAGAWDGALLPRETNMGGKMKNSPVCFLQVTDRQGLEEREAMSFSTGKKCGPRGEAGDGKF